MSLITKFKTLGKITKSLSLQKSETLRLMHLTLASLRGFNYSREWQPYITDKGARLTGGSYKPKPLNHLKSYFDSHKEGRGIWKWEHYLDIYNRHFEKFVGGEVHILEIGVYAGGSLEMWRNHFGPKCHVYGVDIKNCCKAYENEYTKIFIGDQGDREFWRELKKKIPALDIIIDDGSHNSEHQIVTLEEMLPHLALGGVYVCEDVNGLWDELTSYLLGLINALNEMVSIKDNTVVNLSPFQSRIKSIHFYPYVALIETADEPIKNFISQKQGSKWPDPYFDQSL